MRHGQIVSNFIRIVDFIDVVFIMTGGLLQVGFGNFNSNGIVVKQIVKFGVVPDILARVEGGFVTHPISFHGVKVEFHFVHGQDLSTGDEIIG
jgi:hypothetical protein